MFKKRQKCTSFILNCVLNINYVDLLQKIIMEVFLTSFYKEDIENLLEHDDEMNYFSLYVNFLELNEIAPDLGSSLLLYPNENLRLWNQALVTAQEDLLKSIRQEKACMMCIKTKVRVRFQNLTNEDDNERNIFPNENDFLKFIQFKGTVIRMTQTRMLEIKRDYKCLKCKHVITVQANYSKMFFIEPITRCKNPDGQCKSSKIVALDENKIGPDNCIDYQELKIQEQIGNQSIGSLPSSIWVTLEEDLVDSCQPGDDVIICGTVQRRWKHIGIKKHLEVSLAIRTNSLIVCSNKVKDADTEAETITDSWIKQFWSDYQRKGRILEARDVIINNFCPEIYGMYLIKLAIALTIIGGVSSSSSSKHFNTKCTTNEDEPIRSSQFCSTQKSISQEDKTSNVTVRGQSHLLLIGDPGTGKSELLKFAQKLVTRSVLTTGIGSTSAGLTVAAVRDAGEWNLEAGALVLCDGGVCFIDEFTSMKEQDRASIHEAMEQQTISIAKAGMVCKLSTRCSVIAAANPKKKYNQTDSISANIGIAPPLLSRFDLIFILKDHRDPKWDDLVASHILFENQKESETSILDSDKWTVKMFKSYFEFIQNLKPVMSEEAETILSAYYRFKRMSRYRDPSRTTVRLLDSLIRLSQAHARLMFRKNVETIDAITIIILMEYSMISDNTSGEISLIDLQDPVKAARIENYDKLHQQILLKLDLNDMVEHKSTTSGTSQKETSNEICVGSTNVKDLFDKLRSTKEGSSDDCTKDSVFTSISENKNSLHNSNEQNYNSKSSENIKNTKISQIDDTDEFINQFKSKNCSLFKTNITSKKKPSLFNTSGDVIDLFDEKVEDCNNLKENSADDVEDMFDILSCDIPDKNTKKSCKPFYTNQLDKKKCSPTNEEVFKTKTKENSINKIKTNLNNFKFKKFVPTSNSICDKSLELDKIKDRQVGQNNTKNVFVLKKVTDKNSKIGQNLRGDEIENNVEGKQNVKSKEAKRPTYGFGMFSDANIDDIDDILDIECKRPKLDFIKPDMKNCKGINNDDKIKSKTDTNMFKVFEEKDDSNKMNLQDVSTNVSKNQEIQINNSELAKESGTSLNWLKQKYSFNKNKKEAVENTEDKVEVMNLEKPSISLTSNDTAYDSAMTDLATPKTVSQKSLTLFGGRDDDYDFLEL